VIEDLGEPIGVKETGKILSLCDSRFAKRRRRNNGSRVTNKGTGRSGQEQPNRSLSTCREWKEMLKKTNRRRELGRGKWKKEEVRVKESESVGSSETSEHTLSTRLHCVASQKTVIFVLIVVRISNLT
jgi:hypothetical protein